MDKRVKKNLKRPASSKADHDYDDMMDIMESDLDDVEVAAELGMTPNQVLKIRRELFED